MERTATERARGLAALAALACALAACCALSTPAQASAKTLPINVATPATGNIFVGVEGDEVGYLEGIVDDINDIRKEACEEGLPDPRNNSRKLTEDDYVPLKWSTDLQSIAKIRAAESSIYSSHTRPNGTSWRTVTSNDVYTCAENLAAGTASIYWFYSTEKELWAEKADTINAGHYMNMINPSYNYVGMAGFCRDGTWWNYEALEFSASSTPLDQTMKADVKNCTQVVEVKAGSTSSPKIKKLPSTLLEGKSAKAKVTATYTPPDKNGTCTVTLLQDVVWKSSNPKVATVGQDGKVVAVKEGTTTITAINGSQKTKQVLKVKSVDTVDKEALSKLRRTRKSKMRTKYGVKISGVKKSESGHKITYELVTKNKRFKVSNDVIARVWRYDKPKAYLGKVKQSSILPVKSLKKGKTHILKVRARCGSQSKIIKFKVKVVHNIKVK